jgi:hypothetical protein
MKSRLIILSAVLLLAVYSSIEGKPRKMQTIPIGTWGGQGIRLEVTANAATVEYDCAHGTIAGPLKLDKGKFSLPGTHITERGPIRLNDPRKPAAVNFSGWTDGKKMTLTVTLAEDNQNIGEFTLTRGNEGRLRKCR